MPTLFYVTYAALWIVVVIQGVLIVLLFREHGLMALGTLEGVGRDGLPVGSVAPAIEAATASGEDVTWEPARGHPQLLLFATPDCAPCAEVLPAVNRLAQTTKGNELGITAIVPGPGQEAARLSVKFDLGFPCLAEDGTGAFDRYRVRVTPFGFVIGADGRVQAKGLCSDEARIGNLLEAAGLDTAARLLTSAPITVAPESGRMTRVKEEVRS